MIFPASVGYFSNMGFDTKAALVGIAVMSTADGAAAVMRALAIDDHCGLLPVSFPGTVADSFTRAAAETSGVEMLTGPYVFSYVGHSHPSYT